MAYWNGWMHMKGASVAAAKWSCTIPEHSIQARCFWLRVDFDHLKVELSYHREKVTKSRKVTLSRNISYFTPRRQFASFVSSLQKALEMMYIVPKKANDMMNVGMLECYTVKKGFKAFLLFLVLLTLCLLQFLLRWSASNRRMYRPFSGKDSSFRPTDNAGKVYYGCRPFYLGSLDNWRFSWQDRVVPRFGFKPMHECHVWVPFCINVVLFLNLAWED